MLCQRIGIYSELSCCILVVFLYLLRNSLFQTCDSSLQHSIPRRILLFGLVVYTKVSTFMPNSLLVLLVIAPLCRRLWAHPTHDPTHTHTHTCTYIYTHTNIYTHTHTHTHIYKYLRMRSVNTHTLEASNFNNIMMWYITYDVGLRSRRIIIQRYTITFKVYLHILCTPLLYKTLIIDTLWININKYQIYICCLHFKIIWFISQF